MIALCVSCLRTEYRPSLPATCRCGSAMERRLAGPFHEGVKDEAVSYPVNTPEARSYIAGRRFATARDARRKVHSPAPRRRSRRGKP